MRSYMFYSGDLLTRTVEREIQSVYVRLPNYPGQFPKL